MSKLQNRKTPTLGGQPLMPIGQLSRKTGCNIETIRYYERIGLLAEPVRSQGGHRHYREDDVKRLNFILRGRSLGFPIDAVRNLLSLADGQGGSCGEVEVLAAERLEDVQKKIGDLHRLEGILSEMVDRCREGTTPECPLVEGLFEKQLDMGEVIHE